MTVTMVIEMSSFSVIEIPQLTSKFSSAVSRILSKADDLSKYSQKVINQLRPLLDDLGELQGPTVAANMGETLIKTGGGLVKAGDATFKVGDNIAGIIVRQVRVGTNGKIVVIGRQMKDHVYTVANTLKHEGKYVEVLDDTYLKPLYDDGFEFIIEGKKWTVSSAWDDMVKNPKWKPYKDANGHIVSEHISKTPMYKLNKMWIEKAQLEGATIIDIGYPSGVNSVSSFYEMEKSIVNWD